MSIQLLDDLLINKIAAGEVVDRPVSVVKELVENALDAEASKISVHIKDGGRSYIEVSDNGKGIAENELTLAFLRHATSKLKTEQDLFNLSTMGFRGEALPSIASIARVQIMTAKADEAGSKAVIEGGQVIEQAACPYPPGTKIIIEDLFFNTPARKKFLKTAVTEGNQVYALLCRYALAFPDISFSYTNDKRSFFKTAGNGKLQDVAATLWGADYVGELIGIDFQGEYLQLNGFISKPAFTMQNRRQQFFFVNRRPIRSAMLYKAVDQGYKGLLISRQQPVVILNINLPPHLVDVNIHPQKAEVRFKDEGHVFTALANAIHHTANGIPYKPQWDKDNSSGNKEMILESHTSYRQQQIDFLPQFSISPEAITINKSLSRSAAVNTSADGQQPEEVISDFRILGQVMNTFLIIEKDNALWVLDQHAAHERILFSKLERSYMTGGIAGQDLLLPLAMQITPAQMDWMETQEELLAKLGYEVAPLGETSVLIRRAPSFAKGKEIELLNELSDLRGHENSEMIRQAIEVMACKQAIKAEASLSESEMKNLVEELLETPNYKYCPHGRPTIVVLDRSWLDKIFKRTT